MAEPVPQPARPARPGRPADPAARSLCGQIRRAGDRFHRVRARNDRPALGPVRHPHQSPPAREPGDVDQRRGKLRRLRRKLLLRIFHAARDPGCAVADPLRAHIRARFGRGPGGALHPHGRYRAAGGQPAHRRRVVAAGVVRALVGVYRPRPARARAAGHLRRRGPGRALDRGLSAELPPLPPHAARSAAGPVFRATCRSGRATAGTAPPRSARTGRVLLHRQGPVSQPQPSPAAAGLRGHRAGLDRQGPGGIAAGESARRRTLRPHGSAGAHRHGGADHGGTALSLRAAGRLARQLDLPVGRSRGSTRVARRHRKVRRVRRHRTRFRRRIARLRRGARPVARRCGDRARAGRGTHLLRALLPRMA